MADTHLQELFKSAMSARRRQRWAQAREAFRRALEAARQAGASAEALVAEAHLALLDGDRETAAATLARVAEALPSDDRTGALGMLVAERWPAEPRECETHLVARTNGFRRLCGTLPKSDEVALELGASGGEATLRLAKRCLSVYAVEKSPSMAERAREATAHLPNVRVIAASADDPGLVRAHAPRADVICLDIGGSTPYWKTMDAARIYRELYQPRVLVIRCVYLNNFVAGLASFEPTYGPSIWSKPSSQ